MASRSTRLFVDGAVVALIIVVAFVIAWRSARAEVEPLRFLAGLPRATLDAPRAGPAIYTGRLYGPSARATALGTPSALTWWWLMTGTSKSRKTACFERQIDQLELRGNGASLRFVGLASASSLSLLSNERDSDWGDPLIVDLGSQPLRSTKKLPAVASKCSGTDPTYLERWVAQGAEVEVVACYREGELRACEAPLRAVVGLGTILPHRVRRAGHAYAPFVAAGIVSTALLLAFLTYALVVRVRTMSPLGASRRPT